MAGIDFQLIPVVWKDCLGYSPRFASEQVEKYVGLPAGAFPTSITTTGWVPFTSPQLREALFHEASHYVDRSLYQLVVGKALVSGGRLAWGLVAYYYSSFFSAQAAIRLKGIFFVKVSYDTEVNPPPTHRLEVVNLLNHQYRIRRSGGGGGEHQRVWNAFFEEFRAVSSRPSWARYEPITAESDVEARLVEMHQRHLINYVPGRGYIELCSPADAGELQELLAGNVIADQATALADDHLQLEMRAFLRLRFSLQLLTAIADQGGAYHAVHQTLTNRRRQWLEQFECPNHLSKHLETVLT
jgi:hypothetical protein